MYLRSANKDIEAVLCPVHPGEESLLVIPNTEHSSFDLHARTALIQLTEADDRVPNRWNVVYTGEEPVPAHLGTKEDGANSLDLHH